MTNETANAYDLAEHADYDIVDCTEELAEVNPSKPGPKPKRLVAVEVFGYSVGRGLKRQVVVPDDVYKLAALGLNDREIARWFDIAEDTLRRNFADIMTKGREDLKMSLRRAQIKTALGGNPAMLIWLGRNLLGQSENPHNANDTKILPWSDGDDNGAE